jgi:hypothetical protein
MKSGGTRNFIGFGLTKKATELSVSNKIAGWIGNHVGPGQPVIQATSSSSWSILGMFYIVSCLVIYKRQMR